MPRFVYLVPIAVLTLSLLGCGHLQWPRLRGPGPAHYQQYQATVYDPYPENDIGPPVVGGRPRGYQNPYPQTERLQRNPYAR